MNQKKYMKQILKRLKCSNARRDEIRRELESDFAEALANGETEREIIQRMGSPYAIAQEFNESFSEKEIKTAKRWKRIKIAGITVVVLCVLICGIYFMTPKYTNVSESNTFTEDELKAATETVVELVSKDDFDTLINDYCTSYLAKVVQPSQFEDAKVKVEIDGHSLEQVSSVVMSQITQAGQKYAVVEAVVNYDNKSVIYTLTFNSDYKLKGIYLR